MKTEREVLDSFGKILVKDNYDAFIRTIDFYKTVQNIHEGNEDFVRYFKAIEPESEKILQKLFKDCFSASLFNFLRIFMENEEYKIIYKKDGQEIDLNEASESLMAEPIIENGWINRFSKFGEQLKY